MYFKSEKDSELGGRKLPLFPLAQEEGEGAAEVQGQGENMEKRRGKEENEAGRRRVSEVEVIKSGGLLSAKTRAQT